MDMVRQAQTEAVSDYPQAMEIVMREFVDIVSREGSEEELFTWRRSLKDRYPGFYRELLVAVRERLEKPKFAC